MIEVQKLHGDFWCPLTAELNNIAYTCILHLSVNFPMWVCQDNNGLKGRAKSGPLIYQPHIIDARQDSQIHQPIRRSRFSKGKVSEVIVSFV